MDLFGTKGRDSIEEFSQVRETLSRNNGSLEESAMTEQAITRGRSKPAPADGCSSVISAGSTWEGRLKIEGSVRVEGELAGEIQATETVHIAEGANVDAKVTADYVVIAGTFHGEIVCQERIELMPTSRIFGQLTTKLFTVREGAFIDGQLHMVGEGRVNGVTEPEKPKAAKHSSHSAETFLHSVLPLESSGSPDAPGTESQIKP